MKKMSLWGIVMMCIGAAALLAGCKQEQSVPTQEAVVGGTEDRTNHSAPKEIKSDELTFFQTDFYRNGDFVYDKNRKYRFKMTKAEGDVFVITEGYDEKLKCETDKTFAEKLQQVIREYNLIRLNGIEKQTYGLPEEFGPCLLSADYASGENLYFYMNGDPDAEWTGAILDLFAKEFGKHGIDDLLPPKEESPMTRFSLDYVFEDEMYCCSEMWDFMTEENLQALQEIVEETELNRFQNGKIFPFDFDYENTPQYFEFYIEYESGKCMGGFSDDPEECEKFKPVAEKFSQYYEELELENNENTDET